MPSNQSNKTWIGLISENFRLQCHILPIQPLPEQLTQTAESVLHQITRKILTAPLAETNMDKNGPSGLAFFRSQMSGHRQNDEESKLFSAN